MKRIMHIIGAFIKQADPILAVFTFITVAYGLILVYTANRYTHSNKQFILQLVAIVLGIVFIVLLSRFDYHDYTALWKYILVLSICIMIFTIIFGKGPKLREDTHAWIYFAGLSVQPSEFVKLLFILSFSKHLDVVKENINKLKNLFLLLMHGGVVILLIVKEGDMGTALVFITIFIVMLYAANIKLRYFAGAAIACLIGGPVIWNRIHDYQRIRILAVITPEKYAKDYAYQQLRAILALGSGGIGGYGLFKGPMTQSSVANTLPVRQSDFIFAVAGEELGFFGAVLIIVLLVAIMLRTLHIAHASKDFLGSEICIGVFAMFAIQFIANIGMCLLVAPVIGITLPFFSSGGTSVLSSLIAIGFVMSVYMRRKNALFSLKEA